MLQVIYSNNSLLEQNVGALIIFLEEDFIFDAALETVANRLFPQLSLLMKQRKFVGSFMQSLVVQGTDKDGIRHIIFVGLGKKKNNIFVLETYRRAVATAVRVAESHKIETVALALPDASLYAQDLHLLARTTAVIAQMTTYVFDDFLPKTDESYALQKMVLIADAKEEKTVMAALEEAIIIGKSVNTVRKWVDMPANKMTPDAVVACAQEVAQKHNLGITVFNEAQIEKMGMGGLKAVGMGSQYDPYLVILEYKTTVKDAPTIALVGKGITFDTGGLNIKPTGSMETMKDDMAGAAAVIQSMAAFAQLKPEVNVIGLAAIAENMVSGSSNRPGDIITFYNGKTGLVGNTDAEGRLVLADALSYAVKHYSLDAMVDVATLTGAAIHAVGPFFSVLLTQNEMMAQKLKAVSDRSGDLLWELPFIDLYKKMVLTDIAQVCNDGKTRYKAGPINGACFLNHFVADVPWAHLDIAPTAFDVPDTPYYRPGATGSGTRLLIDFVINWK